MKRFLAAVAVLFASCGVAAAMSASSAPTKFPMPWANNATCGTPYTSNCYVTKPIPTTSMIGVVNCAASLPDGFPPLAWPVTGGCPPFGQDFNGIFYQLSGWAQWQGAGAPVPYDSVFSGQIGGYPKGASLQNAANPTCFWISQVDNNSSDPDTGGANWTPSCPGGGSGGASTEIGGNPNQQAVTATPFSYQLGQHLVYIAGFTNTGPLKVNPNGTGLQNVYRKSQLGATMSVGGETVAGQLVDLQWDGSEFQCLSCGVVTVGEIKIYSGTASSTPPPGWAFADGSCISQTTYADLYSLDGSSYGSCSAGNFALPDARGRTMPSKDNQGVNGAANRLTPAGSGCAGTTVGAGCGSQNVTIAQNQLPNVSPTWNPSPQTWSTNETNVDFGFGNTGNASGGALVGVASQGQATVTVTPNGSVGSINGGVAQQTTPNVPPALVVYTMVKL